MLRDGSLVGSKFRTVIGVGHGYGAAQLQALTAQSPAALEAVVLQGFSANRQVYYAFGSPQ